MIRPLVVAMAIALALALVAPAAADRVYLKDSDVAKQMFPTVSTSERKVLELSDEQLAAVGKALGRKLESKSYAYLVVKDEHGVELGVVFELDVIGQSLPITFAVAIGADSKLRDVAVMVYREAHGDEIADKRFRKQFTGKQVTDPIALGKDIDAISGATISSRSATFAARKALQLFALLGAPAR